MASGLAQLAEYLLGAPNRFLKKGTRGVPETRNALQELAKREGIMITPMRPLSNISDRLAEFGGRFKSKDSPEQSVKVTYSMFGSKPSTLDKDLIQALKHGEGPSLPEQALYDRGWQEEFINQADPDTIYQTINAMGSADAAAGSGERLYPYLYDWIQLGEKDKNLVTGLTPDNVNRWPVNQIRQFLRTGGEWAGKSIPPYDFFADPVAEYAKTPAQRLESLLDIYKGGALSRLRRAAPGLEDYVLSPAYSVDSVLPLVRGAGVPQFGPNTIKHLRGLQAASEGKDSALDLLREGFKRGGLAQTH